MEWFIQIVIALVIVIIGPYFVRKYKSLKKYRVLMDQFPGPTPHPIFGSAKEYAVPREQLSDVFEKRYKKYGSIIRVWNLTFIDVDLFISKPEYIEIILSSTKNINKSAGYARLNAWLGTGLLTGGGSKWALHRKLITPTFHFKILEDFFEVFIEKSNVLVNKLNEIPVNTVFDVMPMISRCTLDIICETAMGTQMNIQEDKKYDHYVEAIYELTELIIYREFRPWLYPDFIFYKCHQGKKYLKCLQILHGFTEKVIQERKLLRINNVNTHAKEDSQQDVPGYKRRVALLDLLLETCDSSNPLTDLEIREEVDTFMFEGHDTTAMAVIWALYLLGRHPDVQDAAAEELELIFNGSQRNPTLDDLLEMKYLERVIKETLRLYPSVPLIGRHIEEELPLGDGYTIPANTDVTLDIYHAHRSSDHFPNPDVFNPDNFLPEQTRQRYPYAYIPFSAGPRNCIGQKFALMEEKTMLSNVLRHFKVETTEKNLLILQEVTLKPVNGLHIKLTQRKK